MRVRTLRMVSMDERTAGLQVIHLEVHEGETEITLEAGFHGHDLGLICKRIEGGLVEWRTQGSGKALAMATALNLQLDGATLHPEASGPLRYAWRWKASPGQMVFFERTVVLVRSDRAEMSGGEPIMLAVHGKLHELEKGQPVLVTLRDESHREPETAERLF